MPGKTKRKYVGDLMQLNKTLKRPLSTIKNALPFNYNAETILKAFIKYYPLLWNQLDERYNLYHAKDLYLKKHGKKMRYKPLKAKDYILSLPQIKLWLSRGMITKHQANFDEKERLKNIAILEAKRNKALEKRNAALAKNTETIQNIEPLYIDAFITAYHRKGIDINGKIEIFNELKKFNNKKTLDFFYKLNDAERNTQVRNMAFSHLQSLGKYVKLRGGFKGKSKSYMTEKSSFDMTPADLLFRIESDTVQSIKTFNFFLSHSIRNRKTVLDTIKRLNEKNYTVYCDWTSDNDFLKRSLIGDYTKTVLKKRLEQSEKLLLLSTKDALKSEWVEFELEYFQNLGKPIYFIQIDNYTDNRLEEYLPFNLTEPKD